MSYTTTSSSISIWSTEPLLARNEGAKIQKDERNRARQTDCWGGTDRRQESKRMSNTTSKMPRQTQTCQHPKITILLRTNLHLLTCRVRLLSLSPRLWIPPPDTDQHPVETTTTTEPKTPPENCQENLLRLREPLGRERDDLFPLDPVRSRP